ACAAACRSPPTAGRWRARSPVRGSGNPLRPLFRSSPEYRQGAANGRLMDRSGPDRQHGVAPPNRPGMRAGGRPATGSAAPSGGRRGTIWRLVRYFAPRPHLRTKEMPAMADQVTTNARSMVERLFDPKVQDNVTKRTRALVAALGEAAQTA